MFTCHRSQPPQVLSTVDAVKAFRRFTVRVPLPDRIADLAPLASNLRWAWHLPTQELFATIDPALWSSTGDPLRVLADADPTRLTELASDEDFVARVADVSADLRQYLDAPQWFQRYAAESPARDDADTDRVVPPGIAYFSMEFGVSEVLPIYSGGLGILAGDHLKAASDLGLPLIGVGLLYRSGYFRQGLDHDGWQIERYPVNDPDELPLTLLGDAGSDADPVIIEVAMPGGATLSAQVWVATVGRIPLLLLDSDIAHNDDQPDGAVLRAVTDRLYGGDQEHRIAQEILLGIGGVRALREYVRLTGRAEPTVFHMNEGHAGFLGVERIRELVAGGLDFDTAEAVVRASNVFTTHTRSRPVSTGSPPTSSPDTSTPTRTAGPACCRD